MEPDIKPINWDAVGSITNSIAILLLTVSMIFTVHSHDAEANSAPDVITESTTENVTEEMEIPTETIIPETETVYTEPETTYVEPTSEPTVAPTTEEIKSNTNLDDREMLACVIYQEAGGNASCDNCRRYVGDIVLNRVNDSRFPDTIYEVLTAKNQYGKFYYTGVVWPKRASNATEADAVARAYRIADELLSGNHSKLYGNGYVWQAGFRQGSSGFWCCGHYYAK